MKCLIAIALHLLPFYVARLERPLHLALSYDEEVGCIGVGRLIEDLSRGGCSLLPASWVSPRVWPRSSRTKANEAIDVRPAALPRIPRMHLLRSTRWKRRPRRRPTETHGAPKHRDTGPFDHAFDVAYTTVHTGLIRGGTALNIVPHECVFDFELRHLPGDDPDAFLEALKGYLVSQLEPEMHAIDPRTGFEIIQLSEIPALDTSAETEIVALVQELTGNLTPAKSHTERKARSSSVPAFRRSCVGLDRSSRRTSRMNSSRLRKWSRAKGFCES